MQPVKSIQRLLLAICVMLLLTMVVERWWLSIPIDPGELAAVEPPAESTPLPEFQLKPLSEMIVVQERPLFNPTRRPFVEQPAEVKKPPPPQAPPKLNATLLGIVINGDRRMALLRDGNSQKRLMLHQGETLQGQWVLTDITPKQAMFTYRRDDQTFTESLEVNQAP